MMLTFLLLFFDVPFALLSFLLCIFWLFGSQFFSSLFPTTERDSEVSKRKMQFNEHSSRKFHVNTVEPWVFVSLFAITELSCNKLLKKNCIFLLDSNSSVAVGQFFNLIGLFYFVTNFFLSTQYKGCFIQKNVVCRKPCNENVESSIKLC